MKKGVIPRSGIDTDARWWGYSRKRKDGFLDINYILQHQQITGKE